MSWDDFENHQDRTDAAMRLMERWLQGECQLVFNTRITEIMNAAVREGKSRAVQMDIVYEGIRAGMIGEK